MMQSSSPWVKIVDLQVALGMKPGYIIGLDSATAALKATANYLKDEDLPSGGIAPPLVAAILNGVSHLPPQVSETIATHSGWLDASSSNIFDIVRAETMSRWVVKQYPQRRYPAVMVGATNGAAVHLCAALGIPWLPQTLLVCARHSVDPDEPKQSVEWAKEPVQQMLANNPDLWSYQMHDPNQDRLKVPRVAYFRLKRSRLGEQYKQFLKESLEPGGTIFLLECEYSWLSTHVGDRHTFQFGGTGTLGPEDYFDNSPQVAEFLKRRGSQHRHWNPPPADGRWPEAEWGFEASLREDVESFAHEHGLRVCRIVFNHPQSLSPLVADLYRWWYAHHGIPTNRLLVESFTYLHPWLAVRTGMIPYWAVFNDQNSANILTQYLETQPYDEIYANLFSNGLESLGIASIDQWRSLLNQARKRGEFVGVNETTYPRDMTSFVRHYTELKKFEHRYAVPNPLTLQQLNAFLHERGDRKDSGTVQEIHCQHPQTVGDRDPIRWIEHPVSAWR